MMKVRKFIMLISNTKSQVVIKLLIKYDDSRL